MKKVVIESPLAGDVARNVRFAAWCARAVNDILPDAVVWASHLYAPHFLRDTVPDERQRGMLYTTTFTDATWVHFHFTDLGESSGMSWSRSHFVYRMHISDVTLERYSPAHWRGFLSGGWPPCTSGFEMFGAQQVTL